MKNEIDHSIATTYHRYRGLGEWVTGAALSQRRDENQWGRPPGLRPAPWPAFCCGPKGRRGRRQRTRGPPHYSTPQAEATDRVRRSLLHQPDLGHLEPASCVPQTGLAIPLQLQFPTSRRRARNIEFQRLERDRTRQEWMDLDFVVGREPNLRSHRIARVDNANLVVGVRVELAIIQLERSVVQGFGMVPPGARILQHRAA